MKTILIIRNLLQIFVIILSGSNLISAQGACGTITLTTQAEVNAFSCSNINGNLIIDDGGSGSITDLNPIWVNGLNGPGAIITGNLTIQNCPNLKDLYGLDGITEIRNRFTINNCSGLTSISRFGAIFSLQKIDEFFYVVNCIGLADFSAFSNLTFIGNGFTIVNLTASASFVGFNSVTFCPVVEFFKTSFTTINGFNNLNSCGYVNIFENNKLTTISGLNNLQTVTPTNGKVSGTWDRYNISGNPLLSTFNAHPNLVSTNNLTVINNTQLSSCCFLPPLIANNPSPLNISGNASGCTSAAEVNAPPTLIGCPADVTIDVGGGNCVGTHSAQSPSAFDNCDLETFFLQLDLANGGGASIKEIPAGGVNETYNNLPLGTSVITYIATDANNQTTSCPFRITVEDKIPPVISNVPADITIGCDDPFPDAPNLLITDNCDPAPSVFGTASVATGPCGENEIVEVQTFVYDAIDASGNGTSATWTVTRLSDFSFNLGQDVEVCDGGSYILDPFISGGTYLWSTGATTQALSVNSSGTYSLTLTTPNGCCYVDEINVTIGNPPTATATGATLECGALSVQIMGESSDPSATFEWTGPGGFMSNEQNPNVSSIGDYTLTITTAQGCTSTDIASVNGDTNVPDASAMGGTINCELTTTQLSGSSTSADVSYAWTGPDGFMSNDQNPIVNVPGLYILTVTGSNGCTITADAEVLGDTMPPMLSLQDSVITCNTPEIIYKVDGSAIWSGPNSFASLEDSVALSVPGTYSVTVTGSNSCSSVTNFELIEDVFAPDISASGGVISCASGQDTLKGDSNTPGVSYMWSGPDNFSTNIQNPIAATLGLYTLTVTAPNGCTSSLQVELTASLDAPQVSSTSGTINCIDTAIDLLATSSDENLEYSWFGPNGFTASGDSIQVTVPGIYTVNAINEDGCVGTSISDVVGDIEIPDVAISANNLNCLQGATKFSTEVSEEVISYLWTGPNGFTSSIKEPEVSVEGLYILEVTAINGCINVDSITLISDVEAPDAMAEGGILTCTQNTIQIIGSTTTENATFSWTGPENFTSSLLDPTISIPGTYIFSVTAQNGCVAIDSAVVTGDPDLPIVTAMGGTIDCNNFEIQLMGSSTSEGASVRWDGPDGYVSFSENPIVDLPGEYIFTVTSSGDCVAFTSVNVTLDTRDPNLTVAEGFIDCENGVREFTALTNATDGTFTWTGPDGFTSDLQNPIYTKAGVYMVTVTGTNGCFTSGAIEVEQDIPYESNLIINGNDVTVEIIGGTSPFTISFDDNIEGPSVMDLSDGDHFVRIIDGLGCEEVIEFTIMSSSIVEEDFSEIKVFPNPAQDILNIDWDESGLDVERLIILNSNGQIQSIRKAQSSKLQMNIEELPSGIYYLKIEGKEELIFKKFLKI